MTFARAVNLCSMATDTEKMLEEQQEVVHEAEATQPITPIEAMGAYVSSLGDAEAQALTNYEDAEKQREELRKKYDEALKNRTSLMGSLLQEQKPQYDERKEKRLRNTAIAQSVGDMLSAAARGIFAFNKKGAGYVPKVEGNSALKSIEAINEMQEEYRRRNEAWRGLDLKYKEAQADAEVEAARQLLTASDDNVKNQKDKLDNLGKEKRDAVSAYLKQLADMEESEKDRTFRQSEGDKNRATSLQRAYISKGSSDDEEGDTYTQRARPWYDMRYPAGIEEITTEEYDERGKHQGKKVTKKAQTFSQQENKNRNQRAIQDRWVELAVALEDWGKTSEEIMSMIGGLNERQAVEVMEKIQNGKTVAEAIAEVKGAK